MAEPWPRQRQRRPLRPALVAVVCGLGVIGLTSHGAARAGLLGEPAVEPAAIAAALAAMQSAERTQALEHLVERQARLDRQLTTTLATRQGGELRLRRLAVDFAAMTRSEAELEAGAERQLADVTQKQQRLEALLAEIVQLSRDEAGDPRRLAQLRAVAGSLAQPFAATKAALAETRAARAALVARLDEMAAASIAARQALVDAEARAARLSLAIAANRLQATEAASRGLAASRAAAGAARRLDEISASRAMAAAVAGPAVTARSLAASPAAILLEPRALTARAAVVQEPVRRAAHYDLPEMATVSPLPGGRSGEAGSGRVVPVTGAVVSRFGEGQKPPFDRGLTIEVEDRRLVRAPRDGRVVFARAYEGFGLLLIIDHGNEYHSLLSGLSRFVVHEGWTVRAGQMVGTLEPGSQTAGRLYVELRRRGIPVDPLTWFAAGQDKVRS